MAALTRRWSHFLQSRPATVEADKGGKTFWPSSCQTDPRLAILAPPEDRQPDQINEPLGRKRADRLAKLLGIKPDMILTNEEYQCLIGTPQRCIQSNHLRLHHRPNQFERKRRHSAFELRTSQFERGRPKRLRTTGALSRVQQAVRGAVGGDCQTMWIRGQVSTLSSGNTVSPVRPGRFGVPACLDANFVHCGSAVRTQRRPIERQVRAVSFTLTSRLLHRSLAMGRKVRTTSRHSTQRRSAQFTSKF